MGEKQAEELALSLLLVIFLKKKKNPMVLELQNLCEILKFKK